MDTIEVHQSDLEKIYDVLRVAAEHHELRDQMNAKLHLARTARLSPLTSELIAQADRVQTLIDN
jgi:hypothetical protein